MLHRVNPVRSLTGVTQKDTVRTPFGLKAGDIFQGTVIQRYPGREILVSARGGQFHAHTALNLLEGERHQFQVKTIGSKVHLEVLDGVFQKLSSPIQIWAASRLARNRLTDILTDLCSAGHLKGLSRGSREAMGHLQRLFPFVVYGREGDGDSLSISRYLQAGGLFWENKIARLLLRGENRSWKRLPATDLKGILLSLEKDLGRGAGENSPVKTLAGGVQEALHLIEQDQFLNLSTAREEIGWFWFIPGLKEEGFRKAEVFVRESEEDDETSFTMLIDLTWLGLLAVEVSIVDSVIGVKIYAEDEEKAGVVTDNLSLLGSSFQKIGLTIGTIACQVRGEKDLEFIPFSEGLVPSASIHLVI